MDSARRTIDLGYDSRPLPWTNSFGGRCSGLLKACGDDLGVTVKSSVGYGVGVIGSSMSSPPIMLSASH